MPRRALLFLAALSLFGCAGRKSQVLPDDAVEFKQFHHIAVLPFADKKGKGQEIADAVDAAFQQAMFEPVDEKIVAKILAKYKPDRDNGIGIEGLEALRNQTGVDALVFGRMSPDWSAASISVVDAGMGDPVLRAVLHPRGFRKKFFTSPDEVALEFFRVWSKLP